MFRIKVITQQAVLLFFKAFCHILILDGVSPQSPVRCDGGFVSMTDKFKCGDEPFKLRADYRRRKQMFLCDLVTKIHLELITY